LRGGGRREEGFVYARAVAQVVRRVVARQDENVAVESFNRVRFLLLLLLGLWRRFVVLVAEAAFFFLKVVHQCWLWRCFLDFGRLGRVSGQVVDVNFCCEEHNLQFGGLGFICKAFGEDAEDVCGNVVFGVESGELTNQPDDARSGLWACRCVEVLR
jgi:hypothetical protein